MLQIEKGQDIAQELLQKYKTIVPEELTKIWGDYGFASLMGGYLRVINPEDYKDLLSETYFRGNISVPILTTAFGDIITLEEGQYIGMVKYKNGSFMILAKNFKRFAQNLEEDLKRVEPTIEIPNVVGLEINKAIYEMERLGLYVEVEGTGKTILSQILPAGSMVCKNSIVVLST